MTSPNVGARNCGFDRGRPGLLLVALLAGTAPGLDLTCSLALDQRPSSAANRLPAAAAGAAAAVGLTNLGSAGVAARGRTAAERVYAGPTWRFREIVPATRVVGLIRDDGSRRPRIAIRRVLRQSRSCRGHGRDREEQSLHGRSYRFRKHRQRPPHPNGGRTDPVEAAGLTSPRTLLPGTAAGRPCEFPLLMKLSHAARFRTAEAFDANCFRFSVNFGSVLLVSIKRQIKKTIQSNLC